MIAIINSGIGNIQSVANALSYINAEYKITSSPGELRTADKIIFPGVGAFGDGMKAINNNNLIGSLKDEIFIHQKPFLGICLGMQLLASEGQEAGKHKGLDWISGKVRLLKTKNASLKLPHIGWNNVEPKKNSLLFHNLNCASTFYFVHSYIIEPDDKTIIKATCNYGETFAAGIESKNIYGVQFHPEKSQKNGLQLLANFVNIRQ